jgi:hypothetical protein
LRLLTIIFSLAGGGRGGMIGGVVPRRAGFRSFVGAARGAALLESRADVP